VNVGIAPQEAMERLEQHCSSRDGRLIYTLIFFSTTGQPVDVTFCRRKPILDVRASTKLGAAQLCGLGNCIPSLLRRIEVSNGTIARLSEIRTVNPMPKNGISQADMAPLISLRRRSA
jgi:hypothetical protein